MKSSTGSSKSNGGHASPPSSSRPQARKTATVERAQILALLKQRDSAQSLDDMVSAFKLLRLNEQEALITELVAMGRAGLVKLDRRGRYLSANAGPDAGPATAKPAVKAADKPVSKAPSKVDSQPKQKQAPPPSATPKSSTPPKSVSPSKSVDKAAADARVGDTVTGRVAAHRDGYGFLMPDGGGKSPDDVFLPPPEMRSLMHGDLARVRLSAIDERGRREGKLVEVLERAHSTIVGRLHIDGDTAMLVPSNPRTQDVLIPKKDLGKARQGQMVVAEMVTPPSERAAAVGRIVEVLGEHLQAGMEIETAIRAYHLPYVWPADAEKEAEAFGDKLTAVQIKDREDLRELPLMTIDGADARDFDDALYAKPVRGGGWTLWVAIADVSAYVTPGSTLDAEAQNRGTSVYFPERVLPMLPEALSNGLCSLNPDVDRLCMVCEMRVDVKGVVGKSRFYPAVMRSHARLIYEQVAEVLEHPKASALAKRRGDLVKPLKALEAVYEALAKARSQRGAIDFESTETKIVFGEDRKIESIVPVSRTRAHRLVEECMIAANVEAAKLVEKHKIPALYRVHASPDGDKVAQLREFLAGRGVQLGGGATPQAPDYAKALATLGDRPDAGLVQTMMLRSLMQARYSPDNDGHFGLSLTHYAHFTSPIRRYPDLLLHRAIRLIVLHRKPSDFAYTAQQMEQLGQLCSTAERRADEATRDVNTWLKCEYMSHRVGDEFDGVVTGVATFGLFVELVGLYVDGMVHISKLGGDYFEYDGQHQRLVGSRNGKVFGLGEKLRVQVVRVSLDERKIDLEPVGGGSRSSSGGKGGKAKAGAKPAAGKKKARRGKR